MNAPEWLRDIGWGLIAVIAHVTIFRHLNFFGAGPDLVMVYLLWILGTRDRTGNIVVAAVLAFTQDALLDTWGLNLFSKTLLAFLVTNMVPKVTETRLLFAQVLSASFLLCLVHNFFFWIVASFTELFTPNVHFLVFVIGGGLFSAIVASFIYLFRTS